jgi:para-nitrobenzyl esterase
MVEVRVAGGRIRGAARDGVVAFRAIPYASGPLREYRFRAPGPAPSWDGVRDATAQGPTAPSAAAARTLPGVNIAPFLGEWRRDDECLTVDVWTPDPGTAGLPVLVFLHGGAFVAGAGSLPAYDGDGFAARGVVLVTVNYRLGVEGFLPLPGGDTNVGVRDQLAALRWVRDNITAFGGDPDRVTVFGESAGAMCIGALLGAPAARGLFGRAIMESGNTHTRSAGYGFRQAAALADVLGVPATRDGFASVDPADVVRAQVTLAKEPGRIDLTGVPETAAGIGLAQFGLIRDGDVVPEQPVSATGVDVLAGTNTDEMNLWLVPTGVVAGVIEDSLPGLVGTRHPDPSALIAAYRKARPKASAGQLYSAILTDLTFRGSTLELLDRQAKAGERCFGYEFTGRSPAMAGQLGACHLVELPYVFGNTHADGLGGRAGLLGDEPSVELADRVQSAWVRFAGTGDPGWAPYLVPERSVQRIGTEWTLAADPFGQVRAAW